MNTPARMAVDIRHSDRAMYQAMVGIGVISAIVIAGTFYLTEPLIRQNKQDALEQAIFAILPDGRSKVAFRLGEKGRFEQIEATAQTKERVYAVYDRDRRIIGFAIEARGMGYQDFIELLYAYRPEQQAIVGFIVLQSRETPGLGSRIATDPGFLRSFERLDLSLTADQERIAHPIETVRHGRATEPWQIDGISGATVSSNAVGAILRQSTGMWIPKIMQNRKDFELEQTRNRNR